MSGAGNDRGSPTYSTSNIYPRASDYNRAWHVDGITMLRLVEDHFFWLFQFWETDGLWPSLVDADVKYRQPVVATDLPLRIDGWLQDLGQGRDGTVAFEVRPESAPDSDPLFTAVLHWRAFDVTSPAQQTALRVPDEFRSSNGTLL
jgi:acyl-CoA thioesterase FadM